MARWKKWRVSAALISLMGLGAAALIGPSVVTSARAATPAKSVYVPVGWGNGTVPWTASRTKESADFILFWGDQAGTDPTTAPAAYRFDPANVLSQLESLYSYYVNTMKFTPETGLLAKYKIDVIITQTWSNSPNLNDWATGGSDDGVVGVINIAPGAAQPGSWGLAHELGHVFQNYTFLGRDGYGLTDPSAGTFWETSAEFMAMQVYPDTAAGDLTRFLRTENLAFSSSRHHYGNWMLVQYLVDHHGGIAMFNRIWNEALAGEHPLETYRRINGLTEAQLNAQIGEYAQHQVTFDYSNRSHFMPFVNTLYPFVTAEENTVVEAVNTSAGHYAVPDALAPSDFGYNKIKLVPSADGGLVQVHFKGHIDPAAGSGWSYGFVAVKSGTPRYSPIYSSADASVSFQTQSGEKDVYLVVAGAPSSLHKYAAFTEGYTKQYRYPYELGIAGAVPDGYQAGYSRGTAPAGGHWHANGGGWVDDNAKVAATAYVGPNAAVFGSSTVSANARIEGMSWVNDGATVSGNAVVKDNALISGGANLSGNIVVGGDAELWITCSSGTYLMYDTNRGCDGKGGESDVNAPYGRFTDAQLAVSAATPSPTTASPTTASPSATPSPTTASPSAVPSPATTTSAPSPTPTLTNVPASSSPSVTPTPPTTPTKKKCTAAYGPVQQTSTGYTEDITVTAGASDINSWIVTWKLPKGATATSWQGANLTSSGRKITAVNLSGSGNLAAGSSTGFTLTVSSSAAASTPKLTCRAA